MTKTVTVIGGGIAGLTVASLLQEAGFQVTVIERSDAVGGLAKSRSLEKGYPTEHSCRVFNDQYVCLFDRMSRFAPKEKVLKRVSLSFECKDQAFVIHFAKNLKDFIGNLIVLNHFSHHQGLTIGDKWALIKNFIFYMGACEARWDDIGDKTVYDFFAGRSPGFRKTFYAVQNMAFAVRDSTSEKLSVFYQGEHAFDFNYYMLSGPTSVRLFLPWQDYLLKNNVKFIFNKKAVRFHDQQNKISSVELDSGEKITSDIFIYAGSELDLPLIFENLPLFDKKTTHQPHYFNVEHSNGCQFYLSGLPKGLKGDDHLFKPGIINAFIEAPWEIVSIVQGEGLWDDIPLPAGCQYVLSTTFTNAEQEGSVHHKSILECSESEIIDELLAQIGFNDRSLIIQYHLDDAIIFFNSDEDYEKQKPNLPPHLSHRRQSGSWIINTAPLYTPTPEDERNEPGAMTRFDNLYLAGHYCKTYMPIPTMEKASESGYRAADAILKKELPDFQHDYPLRSFQKSWLAHLDALFYKKSRPD